MKNGSGRERGWHSLWLSLLWSGLALRHRWSSGPVYLRFPCPKSSLPCSGPCPSLFPASHSNLLKIRSTCTLRISSPPFYNSQNTALHGFAAGSWIAKSSGFGGCFLDLSAHLAPSITLFFFKFSALWLPLTRSSSNHSFSVPFRAFSSSSSPKFTLIAMLLLPPTLSFHTLIHCHDLLINFICRTNPLPTIRTWTTCHFHWAPSTQRVLTNLLIVPLNLISIYVLRIVLWNHCPLVHSN